MGLKIKHLDASRVTGTLDGMLPFTLTRENGALRARIGTWEKVFPASRIEGETEMRCTTYLALARFREDEKHAALRAA